MVSYPSDDTRSLSHLSSTRRASSVASSSNSTVRRHHHRGRSHAGGSSSRAPTNEFPVFTHTGDVEIIIHTDPRLRRRRDGGRVTSEDGLHEKRYLLHRLILAQCSGFFEASTSEEWSRAQGQSQSTGNTQLAIYAPRDNAPRQRWRYELDWGRSEDETPMLVQKDPSSSLFGGDSTSQHTRPPVRPKPAPPPSGFFRSMANFSALNLSNHSRSSSNSAQPDPLHPSELLVQAYDSLFRIFYNFSPSLDGVDIAHAYVECKALLQLADMYDALEVVGPRVDHHLLRFGTKLWKQIAKYPPSYLRIGYLAKSRAIFSEAVVHVVGSWPSCAAQLGYIGPYAPRGSASAVQPQATQLSDAVWEIIEDKVEELEELKAKVEAKLWRLTLTTSRGERVTPGNSWLDWLAMSLFRQWLAENTTPPPTSILKDSSNNGRGSSRGSTSVSGRASSQHRSSSSSQHRQQQTAPPVSFNPTGSVVSASAAAYPAQSSRSQPSPSSRNPPPFNTGRIFRLLGQGGEAYLPHTELKAFLKLHPENYDREKLRRFEKRIEEMKNLARDAVKPLMRNFLSVDVVNSANAEREGVAVGYLTCTRLGDGDFPWAE